MQAQASSRLDPQAPILVVEDDAATATVLRRILTRAGHEVRVVADGRAAIGLLSGDAPFQAVLLDRRLPDMDGIEVLRFMRREPALSLVPAVFQTMLGAQREILDGLRAGAYYYLVKPLDPTLVVQVVTAAVNEHRSRRRCAEHLAGVRAAIGLVQRGQFRFQTLRQCHDLSALLGTCCPDPKRSTMGLSELMINALEHGNLGIGYADKTALVDGQTWAQEIERRQALPENRDKWVTVGLARGRDRIRFRIRDMGHGFPWREYRELDPRRMFDNHGRGIILARYEAFDRVWYEAGGTCAVVEVALRQP